MKPHEQTWEVRFNGGNPVIVDQDGKMLLRVLSLDAEKLATAAPDMARALLELHHAAEGGSPSDLPRITEMAREALRKAGVLP